MSDPVSLGDIMARGGGPAPRKKGQKLKLLALNWERIAGERAGRKSSPTRLAKGTLTVSAEGPAWAAEISMQSESLLRAANEVLGEGSISRVRVRAGARGAERAGGEETSQMDAKEGTGAELGEETERQLETIGQEDLRTSLERFLRASAARKQSRRDGG